MTNLLRPFTALGATLALTAGLPSCDSTSVPGGRVDFVRDVKPLLESRCLECHNSVDAARHADFNLETRQLALTTGNHAPVLMPGNAEASPLYRFLQLGHADLLAMPPSPDKLQGDQLDLIKRWIDQGLGWPDDVRLVRPQDWEG